MNKVLYNTTPEFKDWVIGLLHDNTAQNVKVIFTKQDGTEREMRCTLVDQHIPEDKKPKGTGKPPVDTTQRVFDLDVQEWRSFKWESVKEIHFDLGGTVG